MKSHFSPVDQDSSGDWSIVEFRDHTGLGLLEFREVDQDRDGVLQFLEWSLAMLTVAPTHEVMLHSGLAQWVETAQAQVLAAALKESLAATKTKPVKPPKRPALSKELAALEKMWATGEASSICPMRSRRTFDKVTSTPHFSQMMPRYFIRLYLPHRHS